MVGSDRTTDKAAVEMEEVAWSKWHGDGMPVGGAIGAEEPNHGWKGDGLKGWSGG